MPKTSLPSPKKEYAAGFAALSGGLNLFDPPYRLKSDESPDMLNLLWRDGMLRSRRGQEYLSSSSMGIAYAAYPKLWHGYAFAHIGTAIYCFNVLGASHTPQILCSAVPTVKGSFFLFGDQLYYKTRGLYKVFTATETASGWSFASATVSAYVPVIQINSDPATGTGDLYQPENRMTAKKEVWYNAVSGVREYYLPVRADYIVSVVVNGAIQPSGWSYDPYVGKVTFQTAPPVTDPPTNNTVHIQYSLTNTAAQQSISECRFAEVFGGTGELCVVMAGTVLQPNAYYWSGNSSVKMDATYFPIEQVQLASSTEERITGFGKQQNNLIIFKENSVGKTTIGTQELNGRVFIDMPYTPINASIGCDLPWSIQLVENNLVFANRRGGVHLILDTTAAMENNIVCISTKINPAFGEGGSSFGDEEAVCSADDGTHYYLRCGSRVFAWNYEISSAGSPSWFPLSNIPAIAFIVHGTELYHMDAAGRLTHFCEAFNDYGAALQRKYRFPMMNFNSYDCLKNVNSVLITLGAFQAEDTGLTYITDYEQRQDLTNLQVVSAADYEEHKVPGTRPVSDSIPAVFRRRPMCRRVLHFSMELENENLNEDMELISAQVIWNEQGRLR